MTLLRTSNVLLSMLVLLASLVAAPMAARAHPHVWVTVKATVLYENGAVTGLQQAWTFDEMYTAMAIEGLDTDKDGKYSREELKELAQVNIDGLKEFNYFTHAKLGEKNLAFKAPVDYWLDHTADGVLTLHLTLPLETPVAQGTENFAFQVFDPSYFIAFDLAKDQPIKLSANAPTGCSAAIEEPKDEADAASDDTKMLTEAFSDALGTDAAAGMSSGAKTVAVHCAKS
jgi:ABC-type uncharacterized transport system substrate-binding protein